MRASALIVGLGAALALVVFRPAVVLSAPEQGLVGRWYSLLPGSDESMCGTAVVDYASDRRVTIEVRRFARAPNDPAAKWVTATDAEARFSASGTWKVDADTLSWNLEHHPRKKSLWARLRILAQEFRWEPAEPETIEFELGARSADRHEVRGDPNHTLLSFVRVADNFELADQPLPVTEVSARSPESLRDER
jgi:hypothetical protein